MEKRENEMPHLIIIKSGLEVDLDYVLIAKKFQVIYMQKYKSGCRAQRRRCKG